MAVEPSHFNNKTNPHIASNVLIKKNSADVRKPILLNFDACLSTLSNALQEPSKIVLNNSRSEFIYGDKIQSFLPFLGSSRQWDFIVEIQIFFRRSVKQCRVFRVKSLIPKKKEDKKATPIQIDKKFSEPFQGLVQLSTRLQAQE